jgi:hypothetical protein
VYDYYYYCYSYICCFFTLSIVFHLIYKILDASKEKRSIGKHLEPSYTKPLFDSMHEISHKLKKKHIYSEQFSLEIKHQICHKLWWVIRVTIKCNGMACCKVRTKWQGRCGSGLRESVAAVSYLGFSSAWDE